MFLCEQTSVIYSSLLSGILSFIGVIIGFFVMRKNLNKQIKANNIASPRINWINHFKQLTAGYISCCQNILNYSKNNPNVGEQSNLDKILFSKIQLELHINAASSNADRHIIKTINNVYETIKKYISSYKNKAKDTEKLRAELETYLDCLVFLVSIYTKIEWEKVKAESMNKKPTGLDVHNYFLIYNEERKVKFDRVYSEYKDTLEKMKLDVYNLILKAIREKKKMGVMKKIKEQTKYSKQTIKEFLFPIIDKEFGQGTKFTWYICKFKNSSGITMKEWKKRIAKLKYVNSTVSETV